MVRNPVAAYFGVTNVRTKKYVPPGALMGFDITAEGMPETAFQFLAYQTCTLERPVSCGRREYRMRKEAFYDAAL